MYTLQRRRFVTSLTAAGGVLAMPGLLRAQSKWPVSTVRLVVPAPAGGGVDVFCRKLSELLAPPLSATVIVDNKAGAAGLIGVKAVANAPPDGGTFGYVHSGMATVQAMGGKIDLVKELTPIVGRVQASSFLISVNANSPYKTLEDLIAVMKADPKKLTYGTGGPGTPEHIVFEKLKLAVPGIDAVHIPFKGAIEAVSALMGKNIDFIVALTSVSLPGISSGRLRPIATAGARRLKLLPNLPTIAESGVNGFSHVSWSGIFGPAGLPEPLVARMREELYKVMDKHEFADFVIKSGAELLPPESPQAFNTFLKTTLMEQTALMKKLGLSV